MTSDNPYKHQPPKAFWKSGISERTMLDMADMWTPKFDIRKRDKIATYGSCFAQHIGRALEGRGYNWLRCEPKVLGMSAESLRRYGYELFSSRTGNIYTTSQLYQWTEWARNPDNFPTELWENDGRFYDPFRPAFEPGGLASKEELERMRTETCKAFISSIKQAEYLVFTLGLTERWCHKTKGYEYAMCPGTVAGTFDSTEHVFSNMSVGEVEENLQKAIDNLREINPNLRVILTVSPVNLAATATEEHVLVASTHSKAILRAVAGQMAFSHDFVDYFPSYEIINNPLFRSILLEPALRGVNAHGVHYVMETFFNALHKKFGAPKDLATPAPSALAGVDPAIIDDLICEEELLFAFGDKT